MLSRKLHPAIITRPLDRMGAPGCKHAPPGCSVGCIYDSKSQHSLCARARARGLFWEQRLRRKARTFHLVHPDPGTTEDDGYARISPMARIYAPSEAAIFINPPLSALIAICCNVVAQRPFG
ncbi:unnamed protein product [Lasius platythorax]|uniref:Uncharacterized protein n=1 Tax=Lasius platythorax TaxID=488582 RepID=A0AAV2N9Y5_9HYME